MTTATDTTMRVPVRTWQEKAILAAAISNGHGGRYEEFDGHIGWATDLLDGGGAVDNAIDAFEERRAEIADRERLLSSLRRIAPRHDAALEVPADLPLLAMLNATIGELVEADARSEQINQRQIAEATITAIDLRDELALVDDQPVAA
jgi:hypothetical protein